MTKELTAAALDARERETRRKKDEENAHIAEGKAKTSRILREAVEDIFAHRENFTILAAAGRMVSYRILPPVKDGRGCYVGYEIESSIKAYVEDKGYRLKIFHGPGDIRVVGVIWSEESKPQKVRRELEDIRKQWREEQWSDSHYGHIDEMSSLWGEARIGFKNDGMVRFQPEMKFVKTQKGASGNPGVTGESYIDEKIAAIGILFFAGYTYFHFWM